MKWKSFLMVFLPACFSVFIVPGFFVPNYSRLGISAAYSKNASSVHVRVNVSNPTDVPTGVVTVKLFLGSFFNPVDYQIFSIGSLEPGGSRVFEKKLYYPSSRLVHPVVLLINAYSETHIGDSFTTVVHRICGNGFCEESEDCFSCELDCGCDLSAGMFCDAEAVGGVSKGCVFRSLGESVRSVVLDEVRGSRRTLARVGGERVFVWRDPVETWISEPGGQCLNASIRATYQAVASLYSLGLVEKVFSTDEAARVSTWVLGTYSDGFFEEKGCFYDFSGIENSFYALSVLDFLGGLDGLTPSQRREVLEENYAEYVREFFDSFEEEDFVCGKRCAKSLFLFFGIKNILGEPVGFEEKQKAIVLLSTVQRPDGSFEDSETMYWVVGALYALGEVDSVALDEEALLSWVGGLQSADGVFGVSPTVVSSRSHHDVALTLYYLDALDKIGAERLAVAREYALRRVLRIGDTGQDNVLPLRLFTVRAYVVFNQDGVVD